MQRWRTVGASIAVLSETIDSGSGWWGWDVGLIERDASVRVNEPDCAGIDRAVVVAVEAEHERDKDAHAPEFARLGQRIGVRVAGHTLGWCARR